MSERFVSCTLSELLPEGHKLVVDRESRVLVGLASSEQGSSLVEVQRLSDMEMSVLMALFCAFPYFCSFEVLLAALSNAAEDEETVKRCHKRLERAAQQGTWDMEIRPLRAILSRCRMKLICFQLDVSSMLETGYTLSKLSPYRRWPKER